MNRTGLAAVTGAIAIIGGMEAVHAADLSTLPTKAPVAAAAPDALCSSITDFFTTPCQLAAYGVRLYGTVDVGFGYQTRGAPFDPRFVTGASYFLQKMNRTPMWGGAPNALSQSNIGVQIKEPLGQGWSFIAQLEAGFDPYSLQFANSPGSEWTNRGVPLNQQSTNGDSSRAGQFYNSVGFAGVSNATYGTLTVGRQNALTTDGVLAYDPMGGSYAFSPIGFSGTVSGGGDTENARYSSAVKYRVDIANFRFSAIYQFGGYDLNNGSKDAFGAQIGGDFAIGPGTLSLDAIAGYNKDAVNLGLSATGVLGATISNNTNVMVLAKYTVDRLKLYAGYEWMQFAPPSDPDIASFTDIAGNLICGGACGTATLTGITTNAYNVHDKVLQAFWAGARYSVTDSVDVVGAYYHYNQNDYGGVASCAMSALSNASCRGTMDAASALIDWKFAPKWDTYIGTFFSQMNGGLDNGYLARNNLATTAGLRFRF